MRRILLAAVLGVVGTLGAATTASADIGDIRFLSTQGNDNGDEPVQGTAETAEITGKIRCTTSIEYALIVKVSQPPSDFFISGSNANQNDQSAEGVGAVGPNAGNEANSPCSTNLQSYEVVIERNRDSNTFKDSDVSNEDIGVVVIAGTSAENGDRGPGPFIGDLEGTSNDVEFNRTDP